MAEICRHFKKIKKMLTPAKTSSELYIYFFESYYDWEHVVKV